MPTTALPRTAKGRFTILVFRDGRFLRSISVIKRRLTIGSGISCDITLDDADLPTIWGTIVDKSIAVLLEPSRGERFVFSPGEPIVVGAHVLVRIEAGQNLDAAIPEIEARLAAQAAIAPEANSAVLDEPELWEGSTAPDVEEIAAPDVDEGSPPSEILERERDSDSFGRAADARSESIAVPSRRSPAPEPLPSPMPPPPPPPPPPSPGLAQKPQVRRTMSPPSCAAEEIQAMRMPAPSRAAPSVAVPMQAREMPERAKKAGSFGAAGPSPKSMPAPAPAPAGLARSAAPRDAVGASLMADLAASSAVGGGELAVETVVARRTTVRHFEQMNPGRTFPLLVIISAGKVERVVMQDVAQVESETGFTVTRESPMVRIEPVLPGCAVAPTSIEIDCTADLAEARFHVTPIVEGDIPEARVEVRHEGRLVDQVPIPTRVAKQTVAKASATLSAVSPFALQVLRLADKGAADRSDPMGAVFGAIQDLAAKVGGPTRLGLLIAVAGALVALAAYLRNRAKEGAPIVRFLDYSARLGSAEDLAVEKLKARLMIFCGDAPVHVRIMKRRMTIGSNPTCDIVVGHRSIEACHAEIRIEGTLMTLTAVGAASIARHGGSRVPSIDLALTDEVALVIGTVPCLYYREVASPDLDDGEARAAIVDLLTERLVGQGITVRNAFADRDQPVRGCAAQLMELGRLDLETWLAISSGRRGPPKAPG